MEENPALDLYILAQTPSHNPKVCFVPTASGDSDDHIARFYSAYERLPCEPSHLTFFRRTVADLRSFLLEKDIVYVGGRNTKSLLAVWRDWGLDKALREAWQSGVVLAGISAGAICWFEQGVTDSVEGPLLSLDCLGFLAGSCCPITTEKPIVAPPTRVSCPKAKSHRASPSTMAPPPTSRVEF